MNQIKKNNLILSLFYLLIFGGIIWLYQNNNQIQTQINVSIHNIQVFIQSSFRGLTGQIPTAPDQQENDQQDSSITPTNARWQQNSATVYIGLDNPVLKNATNTAITNWNNTKAFTFKETTNKKDANIIVTATNDANNHAAGLTNTSMNATTGYYLHADVQLNSYYLLNPAFGYSQQRIINTAEHELGHAIGLQHTNKVSVMQPAGSYYPIQPYDIQSVKKLYSKAPQPVTSQDNN